MIRRFFSCLLALVVLALGTARAQDAALPPLLRLQVRAESDAPEAQRLKLELRDCCLRCAEVCIGDAEDADAAYMRLEEHLADFQAACEARARELGYAGAVQVELGRFEFPDRIYGGLRVPAGVYRALRVTVGAGEGHNWWCVLYPSLCILDEADYAADAPRYHSKILDWLRARFGGVA